MKKIIALLLLLSAHLIALHPSQEEEQLFLNLMHSQLGAILNDNPELQGEYLEVKPLTDGGMSFINSVYLITTTEGEELIIKIGNPVWKGCKTLNEVSALRFLKENTTIPVPAVLAYDNDAENSLIKAEYIIMPRMKGKPLSAEIDRLYKDKQSYHHVLNQLAEIMAELKSHEFSNIGNFATIHTNDSILCIGGIVDFANYEVSAPCSSYSEYAQHALSYYIFEMEELIEKGSPEAKLYVHYVPILKNLLESPNFQYLDDDADKFLFSHQDFVMKNILVDGDKITAILDWEWSGSALSELEPMTGFDFLLNDEDRLFFSKKLESLHVTAFFRKPKPERELFYQLLGNVYTLVAFREWREGKLEHTAKFLSQKLEQRKIRNNPNFDWEQFITDVQLDLNQCILKFEALK